MTKQEQENIVRAAAGGDEDLKQVARLALWKNEGASYHYLVRSARWAVQNEQRRNKLEVPITEDVSMRDDISKLYFESLISLVTTEDGRSLVKAVYRDGISISEWARNNYTSQPTASRLHKTSLQQIRTKSQLEL